MPDHVHLLVEGQAEDSDCKRFMALLKVCVENYPFVGSQVYALADLLASVAAMSD